MSQHNSEKSPPRQ